MKVFKKKRGHSRLDRKKIAEAYHESADRVGKHFSDNFISRLENVHQVRLWVVEWVLLIVVVLLLAIVQNMWYHDSYSVEAFADGGDYTEAVLGEIDTMNPLYASSNAEKTLSRLLFANIVSPDSSGHSKGDLAKSVKMDESGKVWTLTLHDNLVWSDGEPITIDDVIYTIELIRDPSAKTMVAADFSKIKFERVDDKTMKFTLPSAYIDFMDTLEIPVLPKHILGDISPALVYESDFSSNPVSSGPFMLKALQVNSVTSLSTHTVYLSRNEKYHMGKTKLNNFTLKTYKTRDDIVSAINSKEVTATAELNGSVTGGEISKDVELRKTLLNGGVFAFFNTRSDSVSSVEIRQAIQRGIDMSKVREGIDETQFLDYPILERQEELEFPAVAEYNMSEAKALITKAGYSFDKNGKVLGKDGAPATLNVVVQKRDGVVNAAERFVTELNNLGFAAELNVYDESVEAADFFSAVVRPRDYDILFYEVDLGVSADPFVYYSSTQATAGGWNFSNYTNGLVDDALLSAHTTTNRTVRKAKYEYFLKAWMNDVPAIGIYQSVLNYYHVANVEFFSDDAQLTDVFDRFCDVRHWATVRKMVNITP